MPRRMSMNETYFFCTGKVGRLKTNGWFIVVDCNGFMTLPIVTGSMI